MRLARFLQDEWLPAIASSVRPSTLRGYRCHVERHLVPGLGRLQLTSLDAQKLNAFYARLLAGGRGNGNRGLSARTVRSIHVTLRRALRDAIRWGYLEDNAADRADPPKVRLIGDVELRTWSADELASFLCFARSDELFALWHVIAMTGMRRGEAIGLRWMDVDLSAGSLAVRQTIVAVGSELVFSQPKTARGRRVIALDAGTVAVLRRSRSATQPNPDALVFAQADGAPLHPLSVSIRFRKLVIASGLPRIRLHDLRHTHATLALAANIHPKIVSERLGHSTVAFTLDVYSHAVPHMQAEAAELIAGLVRNERGQM